MAIPQGLSCIMCGEDQQHTLKLGLMLGLPGPATPGLFICRQSIL